MRLVAQMSREIRKNWHRPNEKICQYFFQREFVYLLDSNPSSVARSQGCSYNPVQAKPHCLLVFVVFAVYSLGLQTGHQDDEREKNFHRILRV